MIRRIPCTVCRTSGSTPVNFLLQCSCGISLHHKCVVPAISQEVLMSMVEASTNDRPANSLQTWQCPNCKAFEVSAKMKKITQSRFRTFASSSNDQIDEAYRHMLLKRPIESVYDHVHGMTTTCVNKKAKGAHTRVKAAPKDAKKVKSLATTQPSFTDYQHEILEASPRSGGGNCLPTLPVECHKATATDCRRTVKGSPKLSPSSKGNKQGTKLILGPPSMNATTSVQPQLENNALHLQKSADSHEVRPPKAIEGKTSEMAAPDHDKANELSLPPLLDLTKFLNAKLFPKRRHFTLRPIFSDQEAPPAKRRRLAYYATASDTQTEHTTSLLPAANDNNNSIPVQSSSLSRQLEALVIPIVPPSNKDTAEERSISLHASPDQQQAVELLESGHQTDVIKAQPLLLRTPSPTPTYPTAVVPSPTTISTVLPSSSPTTTSKSDNQDSPIPQLDNAKEGVTSLKTDIAETSKAKPSTPNARPSRSPKDNTTDQERLMEDLAVYVSSDVRTGVEDGASSTKGPKFAIPDRSTESVPYNVFSKMIDGHSGTADSILEVGQGSKDVTEIEAQDTPILSLSTNNCELEKKDAQRAESSFADGLLSPPPTDDETQFVVALQSPSITTPDVEHSSHAPDRNHTSDAVDQGNETLPVGKIEALNSLDNVLKRLPQPKTTSSFRLSTVTVPGLAKCFKSFGLSRRAY